MRRGGAVLGCWVATRGAVLGCDVAPWLVPKIAGDRIDIDRRDAEKRVRAMSKFVVQ
jgi:hypothetical protein